MKTLSQVMSPHDVEIPAHLVADAEVPVLSGAQRQGDVFVWPARKGKVAGAEPVPPEGIAVVRGEAGGNTHLLVADGPVSWRPDTTDPAVMGTVAVEEGGAAYLLHPEHGAQGIAPGQYRITRQREQADRQRLVAD